MHVCMDKPGRNCPWSFSVYLTCRLHPILHQSSLQSIEQYDFVNFIPFRSDRKLCRYSSGPKGKHWCARCSNTRSPSSGTGSWIPNEHTHTHIQTHTPTHTFALTLALTHWTEPGDRWAGSDLPVCSIKSFIFVDLLLLFLLLLLFCFSVIK